MESIVTNTELNGMFSDSNFHHINSFVNCFLKEKEKKTVSSLVEAALDEESDSDTEMEVVVTKVSFMLSLRRLFLMMFINMLDF